MMTLGTAENTNQATGTTQEGLKNPPVSGTGLDGKAGGAETKPEKTYRQSEVDALLGKAGQRIQAKLDTVATERDTYKSQFETLNVEITEAKESIASLTKDIEAMSEDNPDKFAVVKLRKEWETKLKVLTPREAKIAEAEAKLTKRERDQLIYSVADDFTTADGKDIDMDAFKNAADKFKISGQEELEAFAEEKGFKRKSEISEEPEKSEVPQMKPFSGMNNGGTEDYDKLSPREKIEMGLEKLKKK